MRQKQGFTLIELLAVIVILAVIALIATPIIMNVINDADKGAFTESVKNMENAVETSYFNDESFLNGTKILELKDINVKGIGQFVSGNVEMKNNKVYFYNLCNSKWCANNTIYDLQVTAKEDSEYVHVNKYVEKGLQVRYDAKNPGNDITKWKDLSGNNHDGILMDFSNNSTSGFNNGGLVTNKVESINTNWDITSEYTITVYFTPLSFYNFNTIWDNSVNVDINECWIYESAGSTARLGVRNKEASFRSILNIPLNKKSEVTYVLSPSQKFAKIYHNGVLIGQIETTDFIDLDNDLLHINGYLNVNGNNIYYAVQAYDRALNDNEIMQNYLMNKKIHGTD